MNGVAAAAGDGVAVRDETLLRITALDDAEVVLVADVDLFRSESVRRMWPFLRDRRIDMYGDLLLRYRDR